MTNNEHASCSSPPSRDVEPPLEPALLAKQSSESIDTAPTAPSRSGFGIVRKKRRTFKGCSAIDDFKLSDKVGEGTFGEVHKGKHVKNDKAVALKRIFMRAEQEGFPITAIREIKLLKKLKHPCIIDLLDMAVKFKPGKDRASQAELGTHPDRQVDAFYMVFPYLDHDLTGLLDAPDVSFTPAQIKCYARQLFEGLAFLHRCHVLHRDMKGANILISNKGLLKIADFGLARPLEERRDRYTGGVVTRWYRPPELLLGCLNYGPPVDLWGAGCILAEMYLRKPLLAGESDIQQLELIVKLCGTLEPGSMGSVESQCPDIERVRLPVSRRRIRDVFEQYPSMFDALMDLIDKLLQYDPAKRLTAEQVLGHRYFTTEPLPASPGSLPQYPSCHEYDMQRVHTKTVREQPEQKLIPPHPTPHQHGAVSSPAEHRDPQHPRRSPPRRPSRPAPVDYHPSYHHARDSHRYPEYRDYDRPPHDHYAREPIHTDHPWAPRHFDEHRRQHDRYEPHRPLPPPVYHHDAQRRSRSPARRLSTEDARDSSQPAAPPRSHDYSRSPLRRSPPPARRFEERRGEGRRFVDSYVPSRSSNAHASSQPSPPRDRRSRYYGDLPQG